MKTSCLHHNLKPEFDTKYQTVMRTGCSHHDLKPEFDTNLILSIEFMFKLLFFEKNGSQLDTWNRVVMKLGVFITT